MFREDDFQTDDRPVREQDTYTAQFDPRGERSPSAAVIDSVATVTGSDPATITPLFEAVDPDALDQLFDAGRDGADRDGPLTVSFRYEGCAVTIHADGRLTVSELSRDQR